MIMPEIHVLEKLIKIYNIMTKTLKKYKIEPTINKMLEMLLIIKLYHWKTNRYSSHKATDELYSDLNNNMDKFVEIYLGKYGKKLNINYRLSIKYESNLKKLLKQVKTFISHLEGLVLDSDLSNVRDDILGDLNTFIYLLSFK